MGYFFLAIQAVYLFVHAFRVGKLKLEFNFLNVVQFTIINAAFGILTVAFHLNLGLVMVCGIVAYSIGLIFGHKNQDKTFEQLLFSLITTNISGDDYASLLTAREIVKRFPERIRKNVITGGYTSSAAQLAVSLNFNAKIAVKYIPLNEKIEDVVATFTARFFSEA